MKTFRTNSLRGNPNERGSTLVVVVILCACTLIMVGSYLASISSQSRIIARATVQNEARNAAEGMAEYALAEMHRRSQANPSFGSGANPDPLSGYTLPAADRSFIAPGTGYNHVIASSVDFKNSPLSTTPSTPKAIDSSDPVNAQDTSIDMTPLSVRSMTIFGKAAVSDPLTHSTITSYVSENVQIRDETWFNYAIFYNMDMEFHAGPNFTVYGPVQTNANAFLTEGDGAELDFYSTLIAVGKLYRYDKYTGTTSGNHNGTVKCISKSGMNTVDLVTMTTTQDSTDPHFNDDATASWKKFVKDNTFPEVTKFNPPAMKAYVPEDFTTATVELRNNGYLMIEPQLSMVNTDADFGYKGLDSENLKFSALSGFVIQVFPPTSIGQQPKWKLICYKATDTTKRISADNLPVRDPTTGKPTIDVIIDPFADPDDFDYPAPSTTAVIQRGLKVALLDAIVSIPYKDGGSNGSSWGNGASDSVKFSPLPPATVPSAAPYYWPLYDNREAHNYTTAGGDVSVPMKGAMHVLRIDFAKLNTLLNNPSLWQKPYSLPGYVYKPADRYTGVIYVQFPLAAIDKTRFPPGPAVIPFGTGPADSDQIRPAQAPDATTKTPGYGLLVCNATVVPQLTAVVDAPDGFTIATNGPAYIWGNFNADGDSATGSSTLPDNANEKPALIAADALTVLSADNGTNTFNFQNMWNTKGSANNFTEISAAVIAGLVPTQPGKDQIWSGGVHNLVRFLENWGNYRYRGSIAVLFESEVAKSAYHEGHNPFYDPPTRDMGYHQYLSQGRFPPGTPIKRTVRRMSLEDISAATYNAGPTTPPAFN